MRRGDWFVFIVREITLKNKPEGMIRILPSEMTTLEYVKFEVLPQ